VATTPKSSTAREALRICFRQHYQFTVNANGEVTVDFNDIESICS